MKRIRLGVGNKALVVVASLAAGASTIYGCIPDPDISGLPPYDASVAPGFDANSLNGFDSAPDSQSEEGGGDDGGVVDGAGSTGTISGVVIDYTQGNGRGVVPGATISTNGGQTTVADAFGAFTLKNIPAGNVAVTVSKATDTTALTGVAYSTTQITIALAADQNVSVFPVLHEGCFETKTIDGLSGGSVSLGDGTITCGGRTRTGVAAGLKYGNLSFVNNDVNHTVYTGTARIEIIPIAFPTISGTTIDYTWALGLPGTTTPLDTVGATEFRVVDNQTNAPLAVASGDTNVVLTVPTSRAANTTGYQPYFFDTVAGSWGAETNAHLQNATATTIDIQVPHLTWWGVTSTPTQATTCLTGSVTVNGVATAGVWVHGTGLNYFGASGGVTDGTGAFCLDVKAAPSSADGGDAGATPELGIAAGYASTSGNFFALPTAGSLVSSLGGGTCATKSGCTVLTSPIALAPLNGTCVNGTVTHNETSATTLNVELTGYAVSTAESNAGITDTAYIGTTTLDDAGVFCAAATAGSIELFDPAGSGCSSSTITAQAGTGSSCSVSGGSGCSAAGNVSIDCP